MKKLFLFFIAVLTIGIAASAQTRTVKGTVVDALTGEGLVGASVTPAGTTRGVTTDVNGNFAIQIAPSVKELTISYVGYTSVTVPVKDKMNVGLKQSSETLDVVVVTGYGSGKKLGSMTGSVGQVGQAALEQVTTPSFVDALQGKVSGLSVMSSSGDPSSTENSIRLRGINSLNSSNTPLFILDGAPITQTVFATLNPGDIEDITVLKDAASVAIYGSRAANGVIVITSKKGKYGESARVTIRAKMGWSQMTTDKCEMMNSAEYVKFRDMMGQPVSEEQRYAAEVLGVDTKWRDEVFNGHAPTYSVEAGVSGGTERFNYYLSLNHMDQQGIIDQSGMRRETLRVSLSSRATNWLRLGMQANLGYHKYQTNNESNTAYSGGGTVYLLNPMMFSRSALPMDSPYYWTRDENGNVEWLGKADYLHFTKLPTIPFLQSHRNVWRNRVTFNGNVFEEITPINGLIIRAQQAVDAYDQRISNIGKPWNVLYTPMGDIYDGGGANDQGIVEGYNQQSFGRYYSFTYTNTAEYRFKIGTEHSITALVGEESIISKSESFGLFVDGFSDVRLPLLQQGTSITMSDVSQSIGQTSMNSIFVALSYNYSDKYFFDANYRRDGSSYFAPGHRWSNFWSVGALWDAKQEKFLQQYTWLNTARLHASYGTTGNASFANYAYQGLIGSGRPYNGGTSYGIAQAPSPELTWETVEGLDVGVEVGVFDKANLKVSFYNKNTKDMLIDIPYSYTTGMASGWGNVASMRNTGVDIDLSVTPIITRDWYWEIRANMNYNANKITKLFDGLDKLPFPNSLVTYEVGKRANQFYMVKYAGVDPRDGKQMWYTREGNLTKTFNEERDAQCIEGKSQYSPLAGGFGTTLSWKGLTLMADFTWAADKWMINNDLYFIQNAADATSYNQTKKMLTMWTKPGDITDIPKVGEEIQFDTRMLEDASFIRLKTLTLQYALPKNICKKLYMSDLKVHFTGRNLLTWTKYSGYDPEPETNIIAFFYPNTRQYEFGIDISF